jgi:hypothetical protein
VTEGTPAQGVLATEAELSIMNKSVVQQLHEIVAGSIVLLVGFQRLMGRDMKTE